MTWSRDSNTGCRSASATTETPNDGRASGVASPNNRYAPTVQGSSPRPDRGRCVRCANALGLARYADGVVAGARGGRTDRRAELRTLPWRSRPRETLREVLAGPFWRIMIFPFVFAPLMIAKLLWPLWGGPNTSGTDWLLLFITILPWVFFALWLQRPVISGR